MWFRLPKKRPVKNGQHQHGPTVEGGRSKDALVQDQRQVLLDRVLGVSSAVSPGEPGDLLAVREGEGVDLVGRLQCRRRSVERSARSAMEMGADRQSSTLSISREDTERSVFLPSTRITTAPCFRAHNLRWDGGRSDELASTAGPDPALALPPPLCSPPFAKKAQLTILGLLSIGLIVC